jgi:hypothetical protein
MEVKTGKTYPYNKLFKAVKNREVTNIYYVDDNSDSDPVRQLEMMKNRNIGTEMIFFAGEENGSTTLIYCFVQKDGRFPILKLYFYTGRIFTKISKFFSRLKARF